MTERGNIAENRQSKRSSIERIHWQPGSPHPIRATFDASYKFTFEEEWSLIVQTDLETANSSAEFRCTHRHAKSRGDLRSRSNVIRDRQDKQVLVGMKLLTYKKIKKKRQLLLKFQLYSCTNSDHLSISTISMNFTHFYNFYNWSTIPISQLWSSVNFYSQRHFYTFLLYMNHKSHEQHFYTWQRW